MFTINKKILYLMHIDWDWIFQRPQILAIKLNEYFDVKVLYRYSFNRKDLRNKNRKYSNLLKFIQIPKSHKIIIFKLINIIIAKFYTLYIRNKKFEYIWVCYPSLYSLIPSNYKGIIIYDCMDYYEDMVNSNLKVKVKNDEEMLIKRADIIFVSSLNLYKKIEKVKANKNHVRLIRNGFLEGNIFYDDTIINNTKKEKYCIAYIGTVAEWFDFKIIENSVKEYSNIEYYIMGPTSLRPEINNVNYVGVVPHKKLYQEIKKMDCLIMPFKINETVLAVDPVKLYEYISFGKCIISVYYPEIERFKEFVYFYNNTEEYNKLIHKLIKEGFTPKYNENQQREFLSKNSWTTRVDMIMDEITKFSELV